MSRFFLITSAALVCLGAATVAIAGRSDSRNPGFDRLSESGTHVVPTGAARQVLNRLVGEGNVVRVDALAARTNGTYYRIDGIGKDCYGIGTGALGRLDELAIVACPGSALGAPQPFPSAERPIQDFSVIETSTSGTRVTKVAGFASDGVRAVQVRNASGDVLATALVTRNVYELMEPPVEGAALAAIDSQGTAIYEVRFIRAAG